MTLTYKGYTAGPITYEDGTFSGTVAGLEDVVRFETRTVAEIAPAFRDSIDAYLAKCVEQGITPQVDTSNPAREVMAAKARPPNEWEKTDPT